MDKEEAVKLIRDKYLKESKRVHKKEEGTPFFQSIQKIAAENGLKAYEAWACGAMALINEEYEDATILFKEALDTDQGLYFAWNGLGNIYLALKDYNKAIECYERAIDMDENYSFPWINLGNVYFKQKDYDKAIECYEKAIESDETFVGPWNSLGNTYRKQKDYVKAIKCYEKAIDMDENYAYTWNGLGITYSKQKDYDKAIECYEKAIELDGNEPAFYWNLGVFLENSQRYEYSKAAFEKALALYKERGDDFGVSKVTSRIFDVDKIIAAERESEEEADDLAVGVMREIEKKQIDKEARTNAEEFKEFIRQVRPPAAGPPVFEVLRRWNSYTPIIADNYHISKGGGYFLKVEGKGIVIDPGFNFIDNFKGSGHLFQEVDAVLVTHAHNDHTADLESILTLLYRYNKEVKGLDDRNRENTVLQDIAKREGIGIDKVKEEDVEREFLASDRRKLIEVYMTSSTFKKYSGMFNLFHDSDHEIHLIEAGYEKEVMDVRVRAIPAKHHDIISDRSSVGFMIEAGDAVIVYTGDTGWSAEIRAEYKKIKKSKTYKNKGLKLLVAHLGGFKDYEKRYSPKRDNWDAYYRNHLGRLGLVKINELLKPDFCFISEFGEELKGYRDDVAKIFKEVFEGKGENGGNVLFLPADIGLKIDLESNMIEAITELDRAEKKCVKTWVEPDRVRTVLLEKDFSLHYHSPEVNAVQLVQMLREEFDRSTGQL